MAQRRRGSTGLPHLWCIWHEAGRRAALLLPMKGETQGERGEGKQERGREAQGERGEGGTSGVSVCGWVHGAHRVARVCVSLPICV
jgi:hypothetical protein